MVGIYLHGSLATGDFNPQSSDIDFVVVLAEPVCDDLLSALAAMHGRLVASGLKWLYRNLSRRDGRRLNWASAGSR
jgi:predicted nucleotidyltransferase